MEPDLTFVEQVSELSQQNVQRCYYCLRCSAGCPASTFMEYTPAQILRLANWGRKTACCTPPPSGCASAVRPAAPAVPTRSTLGR